MSLAFAPLWSSRRRLELAQRSAAARGGLEAGCLQPRASSSISIRRRASARLSVTLEPATAADGRQARHRLGPTVTRNRRRIAAWRSPRRGTTLWAHRSFGEPGPATPMADTAIVEHTELASASVVRDRALLYDSVLLVLAFGPCFACSCDQKVLTCLLVAGHR